MQEYCHRCGGELPARDGMSPFCPHCGSPQISLQDYEKRTGAAEHDTTGAIPPPKPQQVEWKTAIRCAALVAGVAAGVRLVAQRGEGGLLLGAVWRVRGRV